MSGQLQVIGLCRFSFPGNLDSFQTRHADMAERRAALYDAGRLALRFFFFESFLLPAIRAQTSDDFTLIVLMGEDFPEPWRGRMLDLIGTDRRIRPVFRAPGNHRDIYREVMCAARDPDVPLVAEFRLDDDDAVAVDFVERLHGLLPRLRPFIADQHRASVDFKKGLVVEPEDGHIAWHPVVTPFWAAGLALVHRSGAPRCVMDFAHARMWLHGPSLGLTDPVMFLRGKHGTNDSAVEVSQGGSFRIEEGALPALLSERFAVDLPAAEARWQALAPVGFR